MNTNEIVAALDLEIARLQQARAVLGSSTEVIRRKPGRHAGRTTALTVQPNAISPKRRTLSAAARKKIATAQKKRWAKAKRDAQQGAGAAPTAPRRANANPAPRLAKRSPTAKKRAPAKESATAVTN
jgi:hypothetical protein